MKRNNQTNNVIKYPKQIHFSIGFVIIGVIFFYMLYHVFTYLTANNTTVYEVTQGSISSNLEYNALAIRSEEIVTASSSGNILFLADSLSRVGVKSNVYALDESGQFIHDTDSQSETDISIDSDSANSLQDYITSFSMDYNQVDYNKVYTFKNELSSQVEQIYNISSLNSKSDAINIAVEQGTFHYYTAPKPGLISYVIDGYENIAIDSVTDDLLNYSNYSSTNLRNLTTVSSGDSLYKLITSDHWSLLCQIDKSLYDNLSDDSYVQIEFLEDENRTWAAITPFEKDGQYYLQMDLDDSLDRYADQRFIHIKLIENNISGLKIPNSSIVTKTFFTIPKDVFYQGSSNNDDLTLIVKQNEGNDVAVSPTIYYETDDYYYIDDEDVSDGDVLIKPASSDTYVVGTDTASLEGVYNVNKGYAVFKQIEVLYQNEDYSIIKTGTEYGISMYDHIVLQGEEVTENSIIN